MPGGQRARPPAGRDAIVGRATAPLLGEGLSHHRGVDAEFIAENRESEGSAFLAGVDPLLNLGKQKPLLATLAVEALQVATNRIREDREHQPALAIQPLAISSRGVVPRG